MHREIHWRTPLAFWERSHGSHRFRPSCILLPERPWRRLQRPHGPHAPHQSRRRLQTDHSQKTWRFFPYLVVVGCDVGRPALPVNRSQSHTVPDFGFQSEMSVKMLSFSRKSNLVSSTEPWLMSCTSTRPSPKPRTTASQISRNSPFSTTPGT